MAAGDGRAAKAIYGQSKATLELEGRPLIAHVVAMLQCVPEVSEVWVVGDPEKLREALAPIEDELRKPLTIVPQFRNLYENCWQTYRRLLPGAPLEGRDPTPEEEPLPILYLSADLPFATPQEVSAFIERSLATGCDYALGLVPESSLGAFYPEADPEGEGLGIEMAYFNIREGRFRQSNLHLARPPQLGKRQRIDDMYENRYQKQIGAALGLAWRIAMDEGGGLRVVFYYGLMHLAGWLDRNRLRWLSDLLRRTVAIARIERAIGALLACRFRFVVTEVGGSAVDIDSEADLEAARRRFTLWSDAQRARGESLHGPLPLPERSADPKAGRLRIWGEAALPEDASASRGQEEGRDGG